MGELDEAIKWAKEIEKNYHHFDSIDPVIHAIQAKYDLQLFTMDRDWPVRDLQFKNNNKFAIRIYEPNEGKVKIAYRIEGALCNITIFTEDLMKTLEIILEGKLTQNCK